jgi:hypothetical protein
MLDVSGDQADRFLDKETKRVFREVDCFASKRCDESRHCDWKVTVKEFRHTIEELEQTV